MAESGPKIGDAKGVIRPVKTDSIYNFLNKGEDGLDQLSEKERSVAELFLEIEKERVKLCRYFMPKMPIKVNNSLQCIALGDLSKEDVNLLTEVKRIFSDLGGLIAQHEEKTLPIESVENIKKSFDKALNEKTDGDAFCEYLRNISGEVYLFCLKLQR